MVVSTVSLALTRLPTETRLRLTTPATSVLTSVNSRFTRTTSALASWAATSATAFSWEARYLSTSCLLMAPGVLATSSARA